MVASSVTARVGPSVATIDISASDIPNGVLDWSISAAETLKIPAGTSYMIGMQYTADGCAREYVHQWAVIPQVAVEP